MHSVRAYSTLAICWDSHHKIQKLYVMWLNISNKAHKKLCVSMENMNDMHNFLSRKK